MIKLDDIYAATRNGLDIILYYYPQARDCVETKKAFCLRNEKTPSAYVREYGNQWKVTDFGDDSHQKSAIDIMMKEENMTFTEAIFTLADRYGVGNSLNAAINKPEIRQRPATDAEPDKHFGIEYNETFTKFELETMGPRVEQRHVDALNYKSVKWYSKTKLNAKKEMETTIIISNENYPIFARVCPTDGTTFLKIYQPLNIEKTFRFFYEGVKPKDYVNGLHELRKAFSDRNESDRNSFESDPLNVDKTFKEKKLSAAVICSGERDSVNCQSFGYNPLWLNSESATLEPSVFYEITKYVDNVYNIPDIDTTGIRKGIEMGLKYLDIHTAKLPAWLGTFKDMRGKPRKDLRDFLELRHNKSDFEDLLKNAMPFKFWEFVPGKNGLSLEINTAYLLNFLSDSGFGKLQDPNTKKETLIHVQGSTVREVTSKDIRAFIVSFTRANVADIKVLNLVLNSTRTKTVTMEDLPKIDIDFKDYESNKQFIFLSNKTLEITPTEIIEHRTGESGRYVWDNEISEHRFKRLEPAFEITKTDDDFMIDIKNTDSHYFRYLINASRMYWREELEHPNATDEYREKNKFVINGQLLGYDQVDEQQQNLISKIFTIGYMMHRYKAMSKAWTMWIMEDTISDAGVSSGGSGKSFYIKFLKNFKTVITLGGRNKKLTENPHIFENVSEYTDLILVDDADQYIDFNFFYDKITGDMDVNEKHVKNKPLSYEESPKLAFTSNFPPRSTDSATARRLLYVVFSDYYHEACSENTYKETRAIRSDFGYDICMKDYKEEYWNQDINFLADCTKFYLSTCEHNIKLQPPMKKVRERQHIAIMGNQFREWAEVFFSADGYNVNREVNKIEALKTFVLESQVKNWTTQQFTKAIHSFCENSDFVHELNPKELCNMPKRITRNIEGKTTEMIYIRTRDTTGEPIALNRNNLPF